MKQGEAQIAAVILAAGYSSRMGDFKPLMNLGGRPALERVIETFRTAGVGEIQIVAGYRAEEIGPLAARLGGELVVNPDYDSGMFSSVAVGAAALGESCRAFFVHPVDIPLIRPTTMGALLGAFEPGADMVLHPTFQGERGHPPLLDIALKQAIVDWPGTGGLRGLLDEFEAQAREVPVADQYILADMDTQKHFAELARACPRHAIPTIDESLALLQDVLKAPAELVAHCRAVAGLSLRLTAGLNRAGGDLDPDLVAAAALLHDAAKGQPHHAQAAADMLARLGWAAVGRVAGAHVDIAVSPDAEISEAEVVHLADKYCSGAGLVSMEARFQAKLDKYGDQPGARQAIGERLATAELIRGRMERMLGRPLGEVIAEAGVEDTGAVHDLLAAAWRDTDR